MKQESYPVFYINADWNLIPEHMRDGLKDYVEDGIPPGGFLTCLLRNDFIGAAEKADGINQRYLHEYACFFINHLPRQCYGTSDKVLNWIEKGGLNGIP